MGWVKLATSYEHCSVQELAEQIVNRLVIVYDRDLAIKRYFSRVKDINQLLNDIKDALIVVSFTDRGVNVAVAIGKGEFKLLKFDYADIQKSMVYRRPKVRETIDFLMEVVKSNG